MISLFRNFFQSKIGLPVFIGFLVVVALAFAASDISGSSTFGGLTGDDKAVVIGGDGVTSNELASAVNNGLDRARQQNPTLTMPQFVEQGGFDSEVDLLIDRYAVGKFAQDYGLRAGTNLVNSEILQITAFRNLTGEFDQETYQAALRRQGLTDAMLRKDIRDGLLNQLVLRPAFAAPRLPRAAARQYAALLLERRLGTVARIPSEDFAPSGNPSDQQLTAFYSENREDFVVPERRTIRYTTFGAENIGAELTTPTDAQIRARYEANAATYQASERRAISSFVVPTEQAARALVERIRSGVSLEDAARQAGFNVSSSPLQDREALATGTSFALGEAVFAGEEGTVVEPAQAQLGWYVARIDDIERTPARTLAQAREEIATLLAEEARAEALLDLSERIERQVDSGSSLTDVATEFGLEVTSVRNVTESGMIYNSLGQGFNPALRPLLATAFQMNESQPQLAEMVPGTLYMIFDVEDIVESAAPPLAEVREEAIEAWRRSEGSKAAKAAAERIMAEVAGGKSLPEAMRAENAGNQLERIDLERRALYADPQRRVPTALVLMFSMATGSTKLLEERGKLGWFIIDLDEIVIPEIEDDNPVLDDTQAQIATALSLEYNLQLFRAIRNEVGVDRNEDAILALRRTLTGETR